MVSLARCQLLAFRHQIIIRMLKLKPAGVPVSDLRDKYDGTINLTDPKEVGPALKMSEAVLYHIESREYRAQSRAHLTALAELVYD